MDFDCSLVTDGTPCKSSAEAVTANFMLTLSGTSNAGISKFRLQSGKTHRLRLINSGAEGIQKFSIDGHTLTVFANDFVPIKPYDTKIVTIGVRQRSSSSGPE